MNKIKSHYNKTMPVLLIEIRILFRRISHIVGKPVSSRKGRRFYFCIRIVHFYWRQPRVLLYQTYLLFIKKNIILEILLYYKYASSTSNNILNYSNTRRMISALRYFFILCYTFIVSSSQTFFLFLPNFWKIFIYNKIKKLNLCQKTFYRKAFRQIKNTNLLAFFI